jgi:hypothetical protein
MSEKQDILSRLPLVLDSYPLKFGFNNERSHRWLIYTV